MINGFKNRDSEKRIRRKVDAGNDEYDSSRHTTKKDSTKKDKVIDEKIEAQTHKYIKRDG